MSNLPVSDRESMEFNVIIVGAGPAGLSCAIRLRQLNPEISVCVLEKGAQVGAHLLSGAVFKSRVLDELIPDWEDKGAPLNTPVGIERFKLLFRNTSFPLPVPPRISNKGNYIISIGCLSRWLADQATELGAEIFPGFAASEILYDENGGVKGVATADSADSPGINLLARQTVFAEGCHGFLSRKLIEKYNLGGNSDPQTYGLGIKELWRVPDKNHKQGLVLHTVGWPLDHKTYGGGFVYHYDDNLISIGFVTGLDYTNPNLSPFNEMQRYKLHPLIRPMLEGGKRIGFGAKTLPEGGFQSIPCMTFPGGLITGDSAGLVNVPEIKGIHQAMKSGMLAAESISEFILKTENVSECLQYMELIKRSQIWKSLKKARNIRPGFYAGMFPGLLNAALETFTGGIMPWTLKIRSDKGRLKKLQDAPLLNYDLPDGVITFDRYSSIYLSSISWMEGQPGHIHLRDPSLPADYNLSGFGAPSLNYCPAGVYETVAGSKGNSEYKINAQNCLHCMACAIKEPQDNIVWTVPQGGDGPNYNDL